MIVNVAGAVSPLVFFIVSLLSFCLQFSRPSMRFLSKTVSQQDTLQSDSAASTLWCLHVFHSFIFPVFTTKTKLCFHRPKSRKHIHGSTKGRVAAEKDWMRFLKLKITVYGLPVFSHDPFTRSYPGRQSQVKFPGEFLHSSPVEHGETEAVHSSTSSHDWLHKKKMFSFQAVFSCCIRDVA